jgi:hypothetical protein
MKRLGTRSAGLLCVLAVLVTSAVTAGPALAAGNAIIKDCQSHGQLTKTYALPQLRHALAVLPASVKQYTNCSDVIQQAILAARRGHGGTGSGTGSGSSSSFLPTPVIIILVVLILAAVTFGALAIRRRRAAQAPDEEADVSGSGADTAATRVMPVPPEAAGDDTESTRIMPRPSQPPAEDDPQPPPE